jgi:predicted acylesterase/phospholipase RssA
MEKIIPACVIDGSILLDYYRHSSGADYLPESYEIVETVLAKVETIYAEFTVGHSRFADLLRRNEHLAKKLRLLTVQQANTIVDKLSAEYDETLSRLLEQTLQDTELASIRMVNAAKHVRGLADEAGYVIRLAILAKSFGAAVVLAPGRFPIAQAMSRSSQTENVGVCDGMESLTVKVANTPIVFLTVLDKSASGRKRGYSLILKGGGIKGLAYAGALQELHPYFSFDTFVGTSAGSMAAALLAAGWSPAELETLLAGIDLRQFVSLNPFAVLRNLLLRGGMFDGDSLQRWIEQHLRTKTGLHRDVTFKDLNFQLQVPVSTRRRGTIVFSKTASPQSSVSFAVRCSAGIPFFFTPKDWEGDIAVDGGVQNNLPIRPYFEAGGDERIVVLSLQSQKRSRGRRGMPLFRVARGLVHIWLDQDEGGIPKVKPESLIVIDTGSIRATQLKLSDRERSFLVASGRLAAIKFLEAHNIEGLDSKKAALEKEIQEIS